PARSRPSAGRGGRTSGCPGAQGGAQSGTVCTRRRAPTRRGSGRRGAERARGPGAACRSRRRRAGGSSRGARRRSPLRSANCAPLRGRSAGGACSRPAPGAEPVEGIDGLGYVPGAGRPDLELDLWACRRAVAADGAEHLAGGDDLPLTDPYLAEVEVEGVVSAAVADQDGWSVPLEGAGHHDGPGFDGEDRRARPGRDPDPVASEHDAVRSAFGPESVGEPALERPFERAQVAGREGALRRRRAAGDCTSALLLEPPPFQLRDQVRQPLLVPGELLEPVLGPPGLGPEALERELLLPLKGAQARELFQAFGTDALHVREIAGQLPLAAGQRPLEPADLLDQPPVVERDQVQVLVP